MNRRTFIRTATAAIGTAAFWPLSSRGGQENGANMTRAVRRVAQAQPTLEGAGVHLRRAFGFTSPKEFDPFLLLDDFRNDDPAAYAPGFPWHPHRGIETITYVLAGSVDHQDSLGNKGSLGAGDVQWMTAGSGIMHQEMPKGAEDGRMHGFQLWANLPSRLKMTSPRYQDIPSREIPEITDDDGTHVRVICGSFWGKHGPVDGVSAQPRYLDVRVPPGTDRRLPVEAESNAFAYVFEGEGAFKDAGERIGNKSLVAFDSGSEVRVQTGDSPVRFLMVSGEPIEEPVAWRGPIVMNTQEELVRAFQELQDGTFIKER